MSPPRFTHEDLRRILTDRLGLAEDEVPDDPATTFADAPAGRLRNGFASGGITSGTPGATGTARSA